MTTESILLIVFEKNFNFLFRVVYSVAHDTDDSLDILQEIFIKAFRHYDSKMSQDETLRWLIKIAKNTAITYVKKNKSFEPIDNYANQAVASDIPFTDLFIYDLKKSSIVPNELFDFLIMNILDGFSLSEISRNTGISYGRIKYWRKKLLNDLYFWIKE